MKALLFILGSSLAINSTSFAKQLTINGEQAQYKTQTTAQVTHIAYTLEEQQTTCSREVVIGSHQVCGQVGGGQTCDIVGGGQECHYVGGGEECDMVGGGQSCGLTPSGQQCFDLPSHQECHETPGRRECHSTPGHEVCYNTPGRRVCYDNPSHEECHTVNDTRTEYYSCTQTVQVPYTVVDKEIANDVVVNVELDRQLPTGLKEVIDFSQDAMTLKLKSIQSTGKVLVNATQKQTVVSDNGYSIKLQTVVSIKLLDKAVVLGAFLSPIGELTADSNGLQITTGRIIDLSFVNFNLNLSRNKLFGKDEVIIQRDLTAAEFNLVNTDTQSIVNVDFKKLGIQDKISGKKVKIVLEVKPSRVLLDNVVNRLDIPVDLSAKKELSKRL